MKVFLDSSALIKRYIREQGTDHVIDICKDASEIAVSVVCITEVLSACNRLVREGLITEDQYTAIKQDFILDIESATIIDLTGDVIQASITCLEKGAIRSLDAIHVGAALAYGPDLFVTGDMKQKTIAEIMGIKVRFT